MRELNAHLRPSPDLEVLLHRLEEPLALVANVARVQAPLIPNDRAEGGELVGRAVRARRIDQAGRETDRAFVHGTREAVPSLVELAVAGPAGGGTHDALAGASRADERARLIAGRVVAGPRVSAKVTTCALCPVHPSARSSSVRGKSFHRCRRTAAVAAHDERHAHVQRALERVVDEDRVVRVRVDVDESGSDDTVARVDHPRGAPPGHIADVGDAAVGDRDIGANARRSRAVDHETAADQKVGHPLRSRPAPRSRRRATTRSFGDVLPAGDPS